MDLIKLNMNIEDMEEYEPLPSGPYPVEVRDVEIRHTEKVPDGFIYLSLRVDPSDYPADYDAANAPEGLIVAYARVQLPTGTDRRKVKPYKSLLRALGVEPKGNEFNPADWIGKTAQALLSVQEYQGAPVNNVEALGPLPRV